MVFGGVAVRCKYPMKAGEVDSRLGHQGGQPGDEIQRAVNPGRTRADDLIQLKLHATSEEVSDALGGSLNHVRSADPS